MTPDPFDLDAPDAPPWVLQFVQEEVRPLLLANCSTAREALGRWLAIRAARVSRREDQKQRREEFERQHFPDIPDLPNELCEAIPLDDPLPIPMTRDLTTDECWVVLLAVHDECRDEAEQLVGYGEGGAAFLVLSSKCWRPLKRDCNGWDVTERDLRRVLTQLRDSIRQQPQVTPNKDSTTLPPTNPDNVNSGSQRNEVRTPEVTNPKPDWIKVHFRQKQYTLLNRLWGGMDVAATELITHLGYKDSPDPNGNLQRRVSEANKGLVEKADQIGQSWEIGQRNRENELFYYLRRVTE